ncbi:hypothetical protein PpBr36_03728 [Pyricularia pennisetigena]|uniref:hypothetical protein n=1 Tax=Pyricularia pennisetigena TaxID=1578925 RepID=UPI00114E3EA1|nr:hypothetical protein PpBr36_03728 [Pyricularia pennisetigena]TLS31014.1 hypothetical protein PpBr36_03728 [Pyricularia pennisetigena]
MGEGSAEGETTAPSAAIQVVVLGSGGGPEESNTTAFLVRSTSTGWGKGSIVAVDAGVHLSAIKRILEDTQPPGLANGELPLPHVLQEGPFKGLELPFATPSANSSHIQRTLVDTYLITHPHLDHIAGFVINTAGLPGSRPKRLAGLPNTIEAFKSHIFNNIIWPNLTDENNGAGLVTYNRLVEGGSPAIGEGDGRGYLEISDGLAVKVWCVSHGHCMEKHSHRGSGSSSTRFGSMDGASSSMNAVGMGGSIPPGMMSPRTLAHHNSAGPSLSLFLQQQAVARGDMTAGMQTPHAGLGTRGSSMSAMFGGHQQLIDTPCVYDSSAYFIRDLATGREVLIFGDVEPDSVSFTPRNAIVWAEAAPKIATGRLSAIFIECSYDDSQESDRLYGHMTPRYIREELAILAAEVSRVRANIARDGRKRKRDGEDGIVLNSGVATPGGLRRRVTAQNSSTGLLEDPVSPRTIRPPRAPSAEDLPEAAIHRVQHQNAYRDPIDSPRIATPTAELSLRETEAGSENASTSRIPSTAEAASLPLKGLKVVLIHVKDRMDDDTPAGDIIMQELAEHEAEAPTGCEFILSRAGEALYL